MNRNAGKERVRLTLLRESTTQYNSPQYTAAYYADAVERTAEQHCVSVPERFSEQYKG